MTPRERAILTVASACHFVAHLATGVFPAVVEPLRAELGLDFAAAANIALPGYFAFGVGALPAGALLARFSARHLLCAANALIAVCALGAATGDADSLVWWLLGIGAGASVYHPVGYALLSNAMRARGRAHGIQGVFGNVGIALAPLLGGALAYLGSWRWAYAAVAAIALAATALTVALRYDEGEVQQTSVHQRDAEVSARGRASRFALLAVSMMLAGLVYRGTELLLPKHLGDVLFGGAGGDDPALANLTGAALGAGALVVASIGQIVGGRLADRLPLAWGYLLFHAASLPLLAAVAMLHGPLLPMAAAGFSFFNLGMQPFENSLVARYIPARWRGIGFGLKFILTFGVGSFAVGYVGALTDSGGTSAAYWGLVPLVGGVVAAAATLAWIERRAPARPA